MIRSWPQARTSTSLTESDSRRWAGMRTAWLRLLRNSLVTARIEPQGYPGGLSLDGVSRQGRQDSA
jgi:hypothetical protein